MKIDVHQHLWTEPLVGALQARQELPFVRREHGLIVLFLAGERPYVIERSSGSAARRATLVDGDGLDRALQRGCVGISLPAGALAGVDCLARLRPVLARLARAGAPLLVHPGPGPGDLRTRLATTGEPSLSDPLWWSALTRYVSDMHAAWLAFVSAGRHEHPQLRIVFTMLAGLAPLHAERLRSRGGPAGLGADPLTFYETSSYGPEAVRRLAEIVGAGQLLYGSDRPVVDPAEHGILGALDWDAVGDGTRRALGEPRRRAPAPERISAIAGAVATSESAVAR
jgi:hypothetical protein